MANFTNILTFWFGEPDSPDYGKPRKAWFIKDPAFDEALRSRFLADYELAASGQLETWQESPQSCLAFILLLDQVPRNIFRGTPQAFATDSQALAAAKHAVANQFDRHLLTVERIFIYLPFEHSENLADQRQSVELCRQISAEPNSNNSLEYAIRHLEIIEKFGRFPHRNLILGRESTPEEAEFLKQPGSGF